MSPPWDALADPVCRAIVERLAHGELGAGELAAAFPISWPSVRRHLRVPRETGPVTSTLIELTDEPDDAGAVLVFTQSLPDGTRRPDTEAGWQWYLDRPTASLRGNPMPEWADYTP